MSILVAVCLLFTVQCLAIKELEPTPNGIQVYLDMVKQEAQRSADLTKAKQLPVLFNIIGHATISDPGAGFRLLDVVGQVDQTNGKLDSQIVLTSVVGSEFVSDGICAYDWKSHEVYYASDGAFGGTVFFAQLDNSTAMPPQSYYLNPVDYLGYDPVSGSRLVVGVNPPTGKSFLIIEQPNYGQIFTYQMPSSIKRSANDAFDGNLMNYYTALCSRLGECTFTTWNLQANTTTSFRIPGISTDSYLSLKMWVSPSGIVLALALDIQSNYYLLHINPSAKTCTVSKPLTNLNKPVVISVDFGYFSQYVYMSWTNNVNSGINIYDSNAQFVSQIITHPMLYEDIFVQEHN